MYSKTHVNNNEYERKYTIASNRFQPQMNKTFFLACISFFWMTFNQWLQTLITYLFTIRSRVLIEKLISYKLVKKFPSFYGTWRFITALKVPAPCPYPKADQCSPCPPPSSTPIHFLKIHLKIVLTSMPGSSMLSLSLQSSPNPSTQFSPPHTCYMPHPFCSLQFDHVTTDHSTPCPVVSSNPS